jgi:hypothetical protein
MEASGTTPPAEPAQPPPPATTATETEKPSGGWRALAVLLGLALLFAGAVMIAVMVDLGDTPLKDECAVDPTCSEYFDGSDTAKTITLVLGYASGAAAGIAALLAFYFAATGRRGRLLLQLTGAAIILGALALIVG